jgi:Ni/Co efflux regulator RcnB
MKKLLTLLFTAALAVTMAMPVFAQDTSSQDTSTAAPKAEKHHKAKKAKKAKKSKKSSSDTSTANPQ